MGDKHGSEWMKALPWVLLGRRTAFQPNLGTCSAEMVLGQTPKVPGDLAGADLNPDHDLESLLKRLQTAAAKQPVQTIHNSTPTVYMPSTMEKASHVYIRCQKPTPLGHNYEGPFPIVERVGTSCVKVKVGSYANGSPRIETQHLSHCKPAHFIDQPFEAERKALGRKKRIDIDSNTDANILEKSAI